MNESRNQLLSRFFVQAQLPHEAIDHPYGQWSLAVDPICIVHDCIFAVVEFVAKEGAPILEFGLELRLFRGITYVGSAMICHRKS